MNDCPKNQSLIASFKLIMRNELQEPNTLKAWATGKLAMLAVGLAVGYFLYQSNLLQKLTSKVFKKEE